MYGFCNAVLMARPFSQFVELWLDFFAEAFDPSLWSVHSVKLPSILSVFFNPDGRQPFTSFFFPSWDQLVRINLQQ
jgi:hypothetical protein